MKNYEIIEHRADLKIRVFGGTKRHLFENAMQAMSECLKPEMKEFSAREKIRVFGDSLEAVLVNFLSEINYLSEVNKATYTQVRFLDFGEDEIVADLFGKKVARFGLQIKGVTFHDLEVIQKEDGSWEATVLFDI